MANTLSKPTNSDIGVIRADEVYALGEFQRRTRLGKAAYLKARKDGLRTIHKHGRTFVSGADWFRYLEAE